MKNFKFHTLLELRDQYTDIGISVQQFTLIKMLHSSYKHTFSEDDCYCYWLLFIKVV